MAYELRPARRSEAKPLIGLYAQSGAGKTFSALLLARGFVGEKGRIGMIETEGGRGESYGDPAEYPEIGGYEVASMRGNFAPKEYGAAIKACEKANVDALIIDSASHEWEGDGGVLAQAAAREASGKKGLLVWQEPKISHNRDFMLKFMQTPIPLVILCMRAKYPMEEWFNPEKQRKEPRRSTTLEPKQSEDILSEMFYCGWVDLEHKFHVRKSTNRSLAKVFVDGQTITLDTGRALRAWADQRAPAPTNKGVGLALKAADGASTLADYPSAGEWLKALHTAMREAPDKDVANGLWSANSEQFYKIQSSADRQGKKDVVDLCSAVTADIDKLLGDDQGGQDDHGNQA